MRLTVQVVVVLGLASCSPRELPVENLGATLSLHQVSVNGAMRELSLVSSSRNSQGLVARFVLQDEKVVSVLPTPISSDYLHHTGPFITFGNGWTPVARICVGRDGALYTSNRGDTLLDNSGNVLKSEEVDERTKLPPTWLDKVAPFMTGYVYIVVDQDTPFDKVEYVLRALDRNGKVITGIGWEPARL